MLNPAPVPRRARPRRTGLATPVGATLGLLIGVGGCDGGSIGPEDRHPSGGQQQADPPLGPTADGGGGGGSPDGGSDPSDPGPRPDAGPEPEDQDGGPPPMGAVPAFIAQGQQGRMVISCDDGRTWPIDRSNDDGVRCGEGTDCDHDPGAAQGLAYGDGRWMRTFGWGPPGAVARSRNGVDWVNVTEETTFAGVAFGRGTWVLGSRKPAWSDDDGDRWTHVDDPVLSIWNARQTGYAEHGPDGGRFLVFGSSGGDADLAVSDDAGRTWWNPDVRPAGCSQSQNAAIASGGGVILLYAGDATVCRSEDGGRTWAMVDLPGDGDSTALWNGSEFRIYAGPTVYRSPDGAAWTSSEVSPDIDIGPVAVSDAGTYVGVRAGWRKWYESQEWYRSDDGLTWDVLPESAAHRGHPIRYITFGYVTPSPDGCPAR